jgi:hypothetical protein
LEIGIVMKLIKIKGYKKFGTAKRGTWVAGLHCMYHAQYVSA